LAQTKDLIADIFLTLNNA